jgi:hypothetical protein
VSSRSGLYSPECVEGEFSEVRPESPSPSSLAGDRSARGSEGHWFSRCYHQADLSGGVKGLRNQGEEFGGELYAARGVFEELHPPEQVFQRDGAPAGWEVQVSQPVDGVLGSLRLPRNVGPLQGRGGVRGGRGPL